MVKNGGIFLRKTNELLKTNVFRSRPFSEEQLKSKNKLTGDNGKERTTEITVE